MAKPIRVQLVGNQSLLRHQDKGLEYGVALMVFKPKYRRHAVSSIVPNGAYRNFEVQLADGRIEELLDSNGPQLHTAFKHCSRLVESLRARHPMGTTDRRLMETVV